MGTRVKPIPVVVECPNWSDPASTPDYIYAFCWEVLKGWQAGALDPPNNRVFKLTQVVGTPCLWRYLDPPGGWHWESMLTPGACSLNLRDTNPGNNFYFADTLAVSPCPEMSLFENFYQVWFPNFGYEGFATIFWLEGAIAYAIAFGLDHINDLMLEIFPVDADHYVIKLCSITLGTNISVKISR